MPAFTFNSERIFAGLSDFRTRNLLPAAILLFIVLAAPFPFGSTSKSAIAFWCILLAVAVLCVSLRGLPAVLVWIVFAILMIAALYGFVLHEQISDQPWLADAHPIWAKASDALGIALRPSASIVRNEPFFAIGAPLANLMAILLGVVIGADRRRASLIMKVLAWSGAVYAAYGILSFLIAPETLLWRAKKAYGESVTGTFINRNTAANYFGVCSLIWMLVVLDGIRRRMPGRTIRWRSVIRLPQALGAPSLVVAAAALLVCLVALLLTGSRAGVGLSLLLMVLAAAIYLRRRHSPRSDLWIALGVGAVLALGLLQFLGERVSGRFDSQGLVDQGRLEAWKSTVQIIGDFPWFGTGMGTFTWSFPSYRSSDISMRGVWDAAHSTPLELASEVGLPLASMIGVAWLGMSVLLWRATFGSRRRQLLPLAALTISWLALLHSAVDFTLQVPGYTLPVFAFLGAGIARIADRDGRKRSKNSEKPNGWAHTAVVGQTHSVGGVGRPVKEKP